MTDLGLDDPLPVQYARWLGNLLQGQLGRSLSQGVPVGTLIVERLPATLLLSGAALLVTSPSASRSACSRRSSGTA